MSRTQIAAGIAVLLIAFLLYGFASWRTRIAEESPVPENQKTPELPGDVGSFSIYTNGTYGFALMYPNDAVLTEAFDGPWRTNALPGAGGTPILRVGTYHTESSTSYPRFFTTEVRVSISDDPQEIAGCEKASADYGETAEADVLLGESTFKAFRFGDAGMMRYQSGVSYRKIHEGVCFAIEKIRSGSTYREEATASDIREETLEAEYRELDAIVSSFSFARP
jgi:hypothetical protein